MFPILSVWGLSLIGPNIYPVWGSVSYRTKIEKEKKEHAKLHGMIRTEISGAEIAEEMEKERRFFQLQMCEVRVNVELTSFVYLHL